MKTDNNNKKITLNSLYESAIAPFKCVDTLLNSFEKRFAEYISNILSKLNICMKSSFGDSGILAGDSKIDINIFLCCACLLLFLMVFFISGSGIS